jgi:hypothetical protein
MTAAEQFPVRPCVTAYLPWEPKSGLWFFEKAFPFFSSFGNGVIEAGFETDFGSVPPWARSFVDDDDPRALCPFLRHDKRYKDGIGERADADQELYEGCIACGMSRLKAWVIYRAVRLGGGKHFNKKISS